ncbi:MAG TPA: dienelactone hydrolase family protein, partial [Chitinivibrionales bacterium]|nr:dienelactone hydrolase family protein [Chitinivibrionales bacterium]
LAAERVYRGACGAKTTVLVDTFNASYTVGWKTPAQVRYDTAYPLIVYLHGGTGTELTTKGELAYAMLSSLADTFNLFLASPSANRYAPWWSPAGMSRILQTVRFMTLCYPINRDKIFLAGVSDGATGCYCAANTICDPFAGFIAISGYGGMLASLGMTINPQNLMQRPILNINAGHDRIYPLQQVLQFLSWLEQNGVNVEHREYPDEEHGFDYRQREYGNLASIIRTWNRPEARNSVSWEFTQGFPNVPSHCIGWEMQKDASRAGINAYWNGDTLKVRATGLAAATCAFSGMSKTSAFVSVNGSSARRLGPEKKDGRTLLALALHQLFPRVRPQSVFRIHIPQ